MNMNKLNPWNWFKHEDERHNKRSISENQHNSLANLRTEIDKLFNDAFSGMPSLSKNFDGLLDSLGEKNIGLFRPNIDISETAEKYIITAELPGIEEKNVHVELEDNVLTLSGEKHHESKDDSKNWHRVERSYGSFQRVLTLPANADLNTINAKFKNGVLTLDMNKLEKTGSKSKRINVSTD